MKRRKAIGRILLAGGAVVAGYSGYEWFELSKQPDIPYLLRKRQLLAELAETLIPATDTPGAKEAGAVDYMIPILTECVETDTLNRFIEGLKELESYTLSRYKHDFFQCSVNEREEILDHFESESQPVIPELGKVKNKFTGKPFAQTLKQYAAEGFCISEKGATRALRYIPVPGKYLDCIPLEPEQKAWATK